jgi:uncharacterized membrane protein
MHDNPIRKFDEPTFEQLIHADLPLDELRRRVVAGIKDFERSFRRRFPGVWLTTLVGPFLLTIIVLCSIGIFSGWSLALKYVVMGVATFVLLGRLSILGGVDQGSDSALAEYALSPSQLFGMVTYMDCVVALFVTFHMGILFRIPWIGPKIAGLTCDSKFIMEQQPWMRRLAFIALVTFVTFPTSTTGSIGGSIFGRLLGLGRIRTILGVITGSLIGNGLMYYFAREINKIFQGPNRWILTVSGLLLMVAALMAIELRYRKAKEGYIAEYARRHSAESNPAQNSPG